MKIEIRGERALVSTPYSADFVKKIKRIGGARWNAAEKAWEIPVESVDAARGFMREVYGETDISSPAVKVDVKIETTEHLAGHCEGFSLMGRTVAQAWGRDSGAKIGEGVDFLKKSPCSGGSAKNWETQIPKGAVFVIHNVAQEIAQKFVSEDHWGMKVEIVTAPKIDRKALEGERKRLLARIEEINRILEETK